MTWYSLVKEWALYGLGSTVVAWVIVWAFTHGEDDEGDTL